MLRVRRDRRSPWARMQRAARKLDAMIYGRSPRAARAGERGNDILSLLLDAHDEDGNTLCDMQIRDEVMTLLFAGHDTTTSTVSFMFYELAPAPATEAARRRAGRGARRRAPDVAQLRSAASSPSSRWCSTRRCASTRPRGWGPRRAVEEFEFEGHRVPARAFVNYSSWASHHLPDVFVDPEAFRPERFTAEAKAAMPKGAYVPFGGGSRTCIGMRFGQLEVRAIATMLLGRVTLSLPSDFTLTIRQMPTISPREGLPMIVAPRTADSDVAGVPAAA